MAGDRAQHQGEQRVCLAKVATAHGVKGLVKLWVYAQDPQLLETAPALYTRAQGGQQVAIDLRNEHGDYWIAAIEGLQDRDTAEGWRHTEIWIDREALPEVADAEEFYYTDLIGLPAYGEDGAELGEIVAIQNFGAGDLLEVQPRNAGSYYVPFTHDFVPEIDTANGWLRVIPPV